MSKVQEIEIWDDYYNKAYLPYLEDNTRMQIFYGGAASGKSYFLAQRAVEDLFQGGRNYLIIRQVGATIRTSVFNEIEKSIKDHGWSALFEIKRSDMEVTCKLNGYQAIFKGMDDEEKIKSVTPKKSIITDIWIEEATEITSVALKQLSKRLRGFSDKTKRIILSYNPIYKTHWIYKEFFTPIGWKDDQVEYQDEHLLIRKTTYKDNDFLTEDDIYALENEKDKYFHNVYTLGNWGLLGDSILTNWRVEDLSKQSFDNIRHGVDFGYSQDPAAYVKIHYDPKRKRIYIFDGFSQTELTNPQLAKRLKPHTGDNAVFCDSAEPKSIKELQDNGINAKAVKKGPNSILFGIQWLQQHEIIVDEALQGVVNELTIWGWKKDKNGDSLPIPEDKNNHYIDAVRYALEIEYMGLKGMDLS